MCVKRMGSTILRHCHETCDKHLSGMKSELINSRFVLCLNLTTEGAGRSNCDAIYMRSSLGKESIA